MQKHLKASENVCCYFFASDCFFLFFYFCLFVCLLVTLFCCYMLHQGLRGLRLLDPSASRARIRCIQAQKLFAELSPTQSRNQRFEQPFGRSDLLNCMLACLLFCYSYLLICLFLGLCLFVKIYLYFLHLFGV